MITIGNKEFFKGVSQIKHEGPDSKNPLAFKYYNPEQIVCGKSSEETAIKLLKQTNYNIRLSLMLFHNYTIEDAQKILEENDNDLHKILK